MKIILVIPIFNAMPYLAQTLFSIKQQSYRDLEVLLIDDGSTDQSSKLCQWYIKNDLRFHYIRQSNAGLSAARNTGISNADGDYIWFVDADDLVEKNAVSDVALYLSQLQFWPDILFSNSLLFTKKEVYRDKIYKYNAELLRKFNVDQIFCYLFEQFGNIWSVWCHLFRIDFIKKNHIWFEPTLKRCEDLDWMIHSILSADRYDAFTQNIHRYRCDSEKSIHKQRSFEMFKGGYEVSVKWFRFFESQYSGRARRYLLRYLSEYYVHFAGYIPHLEPAYRRKAINMYQENLDITEYQRKTKKEIEFVNFL